jgi:hypothetical protein
MLASVETEEFVGGGALPPHPAKIKTIPNRRIVTDADRDRPTENSLSVLGKRVTGFDPDTLQYYGKRAEASERGLQQIGADENGKPKPIDTHKMGKRNAQKDHRARESHYQAIAAHRNFLIALGTINYGRCHYISKS